MLDYPTVSVLQPSFNGGNAMDAQEAKKQLELVGYVCDWGITKSIATELHVKIGGRIVSALTIEKCSVSDGNMQVLMTDAQQKKAKKGNKGLT